MTIQFKNKKLPTCCDFTIDSEGNWHHDKDCPEAFLQSALVVVLCIFGTLLLAVIYYFGYIK
jgi:hypothetical protein